MSESGEHRWAAVIIRNLSVEEAEAFATMPILDRLDAAAALAADSLHLKAVRGPICSECRVSFEDVDRMVKAGKPWPCPGKRPVALGGQLVPPEERLTRQQRRAGQRAAEKQTAQQRAAQRAVQNALVKGRS